MKTLYKEKLTGRMAYATAGHDKGRLYVIVSEDSGYVYLSDGRLKLKDSPKKKKRIHIQPLKRISPEAAGLLSDMQRVNDADIRKAIRLVKKSKPDEKEQTANK